jgi:hypothetical protein
LPKHSAGEAFVPRDAALFEQRPRLLKCQARVAGRNVSELFTFLIRDRTGDTHRPKRSIAELPTNIIAMFLQQLLRLRIDLLIFGRHGRCGRRQHESNCKKHRTKTLHPGTSLSTTSQRHNGPDRERPGWLPLASS